MENAEGLNFAYLEEVTGPQTALIMIYFGDGSTEKYRVDNSVERQGCFFSDPSSVWSLRDGGMLNVSFAEKKPHILQWVYDASSTLLYNRYKIYGLCLLA